MSNPFTRTMTPPFTGELWRASALHRRVRNDILVRRLRAEEARLSLSPLPEAEDPRASKLDSLPWGNLGQDWTASR